MLHDLGKLVLGDFMKSESQKITSRVSGGVPLVLAEHLVFGTDQAEIGALLLAKWSRPIDIVNAVRWHHNPERSKISQIHTDIFYLSNLMCQPDAESDAEGEKTAMPSAIVLKRFGINIDQYKKIAEKAHRWMDNLSEKHSFE
ncbi:MAG: HDOD domain-containing protein [Desulfobacterales bacterium]|nr:HDOD domain-containing protein [Desulfobacterales bacterium]